MSKTAFITGAASGIGQATAQQLYQAGWTLALADLDIASLQSSVSQWDSERVHCYQLDVCDQQAYLQVMQDFTSRCNNQLNVLFNCAGILSIGRFEDISTERQQLIMNINVMGVIHGCKAAFPFLKNSRDAVVINMSSASATYGIPGMAAYSASKFAVSALTEALELEWEPYGIRVCDVMPPFVSTPMLNDQQESSPILERLGVHIDASDVARVVVRQCTQPSTHRTVSLQFGFLYRLSQITPRFISRAMTRWLNRS